MGRIVSGGSVVHDQLDIVNSGGVRVQNVALANLSLILFVNGAVLPWSLVDGDSVPDSSIISDSIYFHQIQAGYYEIRFLPDRVGFWRIVVLVPSLNLEIIREYDVLAAGALKPGGSSGLIASFTKP